MLMKSSWFASIFLILLTGCVTIKPGQLTRGTAWLAGTDKHTRDEGGVTKSINAVPGEGPGKQDTKQGKSTGPGTAPKGFIHHPSGVALFKATLDIKKHHLTGLLVIKRMDSSASSGHDSARVHPVYRIVFANEIGLTFFDLEMKPESFRVVSCFESLNKKALMKILETDFRLLTGMDTLKSGRNYTQSGTNNRVIAGKAGKFSVWHTYSPSGDTLFRTAGKSTIADPAILEYLKYADGYPVKITIKNPFIGLKLSLRLLDRK